MLFRSKTDYRGELLICASAKPCPGTIAGHALCTVELVDIEPFTREHLYGSYMDEMPPDGCYAWHINLKDWIEPKPVKGKLHLFDVVEPLKVIPETLSNREALAKYYEPLIYWGRDKADSQKMWSQILNSCEATCWA